MAKLIGYQLPAPLPPKAIEELRATLRKVSAADPQSHTYLTHYMLSTDTQSLFPESSPESVHAFTIACWECLPALLDELEDLRCRIQRACSVPTEHRINALLPTPRQPDDVMADMRRALGAPEPTEGECFSVELPRPEKWWGVDSQPYSSLLTIMFGADRLPVLAPVLGNASDRGWTLTLTARKPTP